MTGRLLAGRYRLMSAIGRGGMGLVWQGRDEVLHRDVAVKEVLLPDDLEDSERSELCGRALREARAAGLLDHPGIITVHDVVVEDDRPWIVMELVVGRSLDRAAPLPVPVVARIGLRVLEALRVAHARGVLHRDVKPTNILLADDGRVILTDFGIASLEGDPSLTRTGAFIGSPGFVAPERLREEPVGPASDLWSLGATLYMAVEGRAPYDRGTSMAALGAVLTEEPPPPVRAGLLAPVLWHLLAKDPAVRPSPDDAARALAQVSYGADSGLRVPTPPGTGRPRRARLWLPAGAALAGLLVVAGAIVAFRPGGHRDRGPAATTAAAPAATPSPASTSDARYVRPFDFCALLTSAQVEQLMPGATKFPPDDAHSCAWGVAAKHQAISVESDETFDAQGDLQADPWTATAAGARKSFEAALSADRKASDDVAWGWTEIGVRRVNARQSAARTLSGIGDRAYATDTSSGRRAERTEVLFQDSNLLIRIWYVSAGGTADAAHIRKGAAGTARLVERSLRRMP